MNIDKNIGNYTYEELTTILGLVYPASDKDINEKTDTYIAKYKNNEEMITFFEDIRTALLEENDDLQVKKEETSQNTFNVRVKKDVLNPLLTNVTTRLVNIDSQYRNDTFENMNGYDNASEFSSTYFNANLCDHLYNVLSIEIDNAIIPKTWYLIDGAYNNNFFWVTNKKEDFIIVVDSGNYTGDELVAAVNTAFATAGFTNPENVSICEYAPLTNKFTFRLDGWIDPMGNRIDANEIEEIEDLELYPYFTFYDIGNIKFYKYIEKYGEAPEPLNFCTLPVMTIDNMFGWLLGFRLPYVFVKNENTGVVPVNLNGTSYFLLVLMDYQTNRVNNDIITIVNKNDSKIALPNYINASLLYNCVETKNEIQSIANENNVNQLLFNKSSMSKSKIKQFIPSAPRILTQNQLYTTNEILKNNLMKTIDYRSSGPTTNDVLALIPVNSQGIKNGFLYVQDKIRTNKRVFFGPVNIDRFTVKLINDKGQIVNLNGSDWSFTLNVEILYQL
jgi:uncharacterized protein YerC